MLPNEYQLLEYLQSSGTQYIDTGVSPADYLNLLKIEADMAYVTTPTGSSTQSYLFGSGYYSSTASNRRNILVGYRGATATTNFVYLNGSQLSNAVIKLNAIVDANRHTFIIDQINSEYIFDSNTQAFTTTVNSNLTATLKIFATHQSGSSGNPVGYFSSANLYEFKIYANDELIRDFVPARRKSDDVLGLYDLVNDTFYTNAGTGTFIAGADVCEISATATPAYGGYVTGSGRYQVNDTVTLQAVSKPRYEFEEWSDGNTDNPRTITVTESAEFVAIFKKIKVTIGGTYFLYGKKRWSPYVVPLPDDPLDTPPTFFTEVESADISEDLLQKATSTIVCKDVVTLEEGDLIFIRDVKGNVVYNGFIEVVNGNEITTKQAQAFFDFSLYAKIDSNSDKADYPSYTFMKMLSRYLNDILRGYVSTQADTSDVLQRRMENGVQVSVVEPSATLPTYPYRTENEVINGEELLYQMYSQFEVIPYLWVSYTGHKDSADPFRPWLATEWTTFYLFLAEDMEDGNEYIPPYRAINLGDNVEFVSDIDVITTAEDNNVLIIYDSTGSTYRGAYCIKTDGTYGDLSGTDLRYVPPTKKYVNSDEDLTVIRNAELKRIQHNHKVTFTFDLNNNFYDFGDINLGQSINFYVGDRLYNSVLTGWSFHIEKDTQLSSVKMVCGKVRNNLTSKLNLGKVKR